MKINALIEKLKNEYGENGIYKVLEVNIEDMKKLIQTKNKLHNSKLLEYYKKIDEKYDFIYGMLWGLAATNYITSMEREKMIEELIEFVTQNY